MLRSLSMDTGWRHPGVCRYFRPHGEYFASVFTHRAAPHPRVLQPTLQILVMPGTWALGIWMKDTIPTLKEPTDWWEISYIRERWGWWMRITGDPQPCPCLRASDLLNNAWVRANEQESAPRDSFTEEGNVSNHHLRREARALLQNRSIISI